MTTLTPEKRLRLLDVHDRAAIYDRPSFTEEERQGYFTLTPAEEVGLATFTDGAVHAFFVLTLGYFKAKQRFFSVKRADVLPDLLWICDQRGLVVEADALRIPNDRTLQQLRQFILEFTGYRRCQPADRQQAFQVALQAARVSPKVPYLLRIVLRHFAMAKIILPGYTYLQEEIISQALTTEEDRLVGLLAQHLTDPDRVALDALFERQDGRYRVTLLRRVPRTLGARDLRRERDRAEELQPLVVIAHRILPHLDLSPDAQRAYAHMVSFYTAAGLKRLTSDLVYIYLLCFVHHRIQRLHDHLISGLMQVVKTIRDEAKTKAQEQVATYRFQRSQDMVRAGQVLQLFTSDQLAPTTPFAQAQAHAFAVLDRERLDRVATYIATGADCDETAFFWQHIDTCAQRFKSRTRSLLGGVTLTTPQAQTPLLTAVQFLQQTFARGWALTRVDPQTIPTQCIPVRLRRYLYTRTADGDPQLILDRYEFLISLLVRAALESGDLVCRESIRFRSLEDDLIPLAEWRTNKAALIAATNLPILQQPITEQLAALEHELEAQFARVNGRIAAGTNPAIQVTQHGTTRKWTLQTPKPREVANHALYERLPQASLAQVLAAVDAECGFMQAFEHVLGRRTHHTRDDRVVHACLIAWGTNLGLHRMGEMSDIPASTLVRTSGNYLRLETLRAASTMIINALAAMPLFQAYDIDGERHTSSDGQKFETGLDTLNAQHSPKYFGLGKGVVADTLIMNNIPVNTNLISAHDPESHDVFDLLYNNPTDLRSTIHSTDTHGTNRVNFALLKVFGHRFAPRYADLQERMRTSLYGFQSPAAYGADALFRPQRKLNTPLIVSEWDPLQRIFVSLAQKTISQRLLVTKLSSSKRRNRMLQALWEYDHIPRSSYLLEFVDSPRLRQNVQQALNRGEQYHHLRRALTHGNAGKLRYLTEEDQEVWNEASRLLVNAILFYNMRILEQAIAAKEAAGEVADAAFLRTVSPVAWHHINFYGKFSFYADVMPAPIADCIAAVLAYRRAAGDQGPVGEPEANEA